MHSTIVFLFLAALATLALAAPMAHSPRSSIQRSFRVEHAGRAKLSAQNELERAYRKFNIPQHHRKASDDSDDTSAASSSTPAADSSTDSTSSSGSGAGGEVTATPVQGGSAYVAPVNIGGQTLNLDFDTGSSDLWVFSTELAPGVGAGHTLFNPSESSTFTTYSGANWSTHYGDGSSASGSVGFDTVSIGGATVRKQCVELADEMEGFQSLTASDGLLGLGFSTINQVKPVAQKTFWENILDSLDQPVFTADLDVTAAGDYDFGTIDSSKYTGDIHYVDIDSSSGYWMFDSPSFSIAGKEHSCTSCSPIIADTGTSLLLLEDTVVKAYYGAVSSAKYVSDEGLFYYSCDETLPDFGLAIGSGYIANLAGDKLQYQANGDGTCIGGIQWNGGGDLAIAGDMFFRQYFAVFDGGNTQLGVALKA